MRDITKEVAFKVSAGALSTLVLLDTGKVVACGLNNYGQLGNNSTTDSNVLVSMSSSAGYENGYPHNPNAIDIVSGFYHNLVLLNTGKVVGCGRGTSGRLGNNSTTTINKLLVSVSSANGYDQTNAISIGAGEEFSTILLNTGKVISFGTNRYVGIGDSSSTNKQTTPINITAENGYYSNNVISINSGFQHTIILLNTGKILMFGWESEGCFINGSTSNTYKVMEPTTGSDYDGTNVVLENITYIICRRGNSL